MGSDGFSASPKKEETKMNKMKSKKIGIQRKMASNLWLMRLAYFIKEFIVIIRHKYKRWANYYGLEIVCDFYPFHFSHSSQ